MFFDIDGTLTSFVTHKVPNSTVEAIQRLQSAGIKVLICTGRAFSDEGGAGHHADLIRRHCGVQWSILFDEQGYLESQALDQSDIRVILDWLDQHPDVVCDFGEKNYVYFNHHTNEALQQTGAVLAKPPRPIFRESSFAGVDARDLQISPFIDPELEDELVGLCSNIRGVRWHPTSPI